MSRLVDFDWVVNDIVSSSMCDDHSVFAGKNAGSDSSSSSSNNTNSINSNGGGKNFVLSGADEECLHRDDGSDERNAGAAGLKEPLACILRLELLINELNPADQSRQIRPHLVELSAAEIDAMIKTLKSALA